MGLVNLAEVGSDVWLVCREGPLKEVKFQVSLGGTAGVWRSDRSVGGIAGRRKANTKA